MQATDADRATARALREAWNHFGYPDTHAVSIPVLESIERVILDHLESLDQPQILLMGPHGGTMFKGVELVIARVPA